MIVTTTKRKMHAYMGPDGLMDRDTVLCTLCFEHAPNRVEIYQKLKGAWDIAKYGTQGGLTNPENSVFDVTGWAETLNNPPRCIKCQYASNDTGLTVSSLASIFGAEEGWAFDDQHKYEPILAQITDNNNRRVMYEVIGIDTETYEDEAVLLTLRYCVEPQATLGDPIDYPIYGDPEYPRTLNGMYAFLPWDNNPYGGRLVWVAQDETIDVATEVGDIDGISPENARNLISILNEGLKLLVERDNTPTGTLAFEKGKRGIRLIHCRACNKEFSTAMGKTNVVCINCEAQGRHWLFSLILNTTNPAAQRPYGVQLHDLRKPEQKAVWNIWTFTREEQVGLLKQFASDPLGTVDALRHIELQDEDGEPSLFE